MKQKVHSVSYFAKAEFELKNGVYDLVALPAGAEVVKVSLEIVGDIKGKQGSINVGFKDELAKNYFFTLNLDDAMFFSAHQTITNSRDYTVTSNNAVIAEVENTAKNDSKCVLRVLYFLPSVIEVEY